MYEDIQDKVRQAQDIETVHNDIFECELLRFDVRKYNDGHNDAHNDVHIYVITHKNRDV